MRSNGGLTSLNDCVIQLQDGDTFRTNAFDQFARYWHSGIVRNCEVDLETLDQVEDELVTAVKPLALTDARGERAANFRHVEIGQVQFLGSFRKPVKRDGINYQLDSLHGLAPRYGGRELIIQCEDNCIACADEKLSFSKGLL